MDKQREREKSYKERSDILVRYEKTYYRQAMQIKKDRHKCKREKNAFWIYMPK